MNVKRVRGLAYDTGVNAKCFTSEDTNLRAFWCKLLRVSIRQVRGF